MNLSLVRFSSKIAVESGKAKYTSISVACKMLLLTYFPFIELVSSTEDPNPEEPFADDSNGKTIIMIVLGIYIAVLSTIITLVLLQDRKKFSAKLAAEAKAKAEEEAIIRKKIEKAMKNEYN